MKGLLSGELGLFFSQLQRILSLYKHTDVAILLNKGNGVIKALRVLYSDLEGILIKISGLKSQEVLNEIRKNSNKNNCKIRTFYSSNYLPYSENHSRIDYYF